MRGWVGEWGRRSMEWPTHGVGTWWQVAGGEQDAVLEKGP
jgi:hypothetical protein